MHNFTAHTLEIEAEALSPVHLNRQKGSAIRGALFWALRGSNHPRAAWQGFCTNKAAPSCWECPLHAACPVSTLVSTLDATSRWGRDAVRPYVIRPPLDGGKMCYQPGASLPSARDGSITPPATTRPTCTSLRPRCWPTSRSTAIGSAASTCPIGEQREGNNTCRCATRRGLSALRKSSPPS